jgi:hypothetical protein
MIAMFRGGEKTAEDAGQIAEPHLLVITSALIRMTIGKLNQLRLFGLCVITHKMSRKFDSHLVVSLAFRAILRSFEMIFRRDGPPYSQ